MDSDIQEIETMEEAVNFLQEFIPYDDLITIARLLQEARENGYAVVKVLVVDKKVNGLRLEKFYK